MLHDLFTRSAAMPARHRISLLFVSLVLAGCSGSGGAELPITPTPTLTRNPIQSTPWASPDAAFAAVAGTYRQAGGATWVVDLQGLLVDLHTGIARAMAPAESRDAFVVGPNMGAATPSAGEATFLVDGAGESTELHVGDAGLGEFSAARVPYASREVRFRSGAATLAGTLSEPTHGSHFPGIVLIHGSGVQPRPLFSLWANVYNSMGFAVLNYDKRGTGESGGTYPGELATPESLSIYADDAVAGAKFLERQPEIDPHLVGLHGGSQGGWIAPLALERAPDLAFAVLASAPAVTTDQQQTYQDFSGSSRFVPSQSDAEIQAQVRAAMGGYDPAKALRALHVPTIWVYGSKDRQVPVGLSLENLRKLRGKDLSIVVLPGGWHGLTLTPDGLEPEAAQSTGFCPALFTQIGAWLASHHLTAMPP
jgi:uncharacterized protein